MKTCPVCRRRHEGRSSSCYLQSPVLLLSSLDSSDPVTTADFVERLKIKHRLVRKAVRDLNDLFGGHMGLSVFSLCVYTMFDIYYHFLGIINPTMSYVLVYGWMLQYFTRFGTITILAHITIKQVTFKMKTFNRACTYTCVILMSEVTTEVGLSKAPLGET